ncbi:rhodanese-like domain-containing protein [Candidatus Omnitrophota bacterium]
MKKILSICLILVMVSAVASAGNVYDKIKKEATVTPEGIREITYDQFIEIKKSKEKYVVLDVLDPESYVDGHIPGAKNLPLGDINKKNAKAKLKKNSNIVVYCASFKCMASVHAAKKLGALGYKNVLDFKGGLKEWKDKGNGLVI